IAANYGDTDGNELVYALTHHKDGTSNGVATYKIAQSIPSGTTPYIQESDIAAAIANNDPVVEFINAKAFGRSYAGHWLVVSGLTSDGTSTWVIFNDPDNQAARSGYPNWIVGGAYIAVALSTF